MSRPPPKQERKPKQHRRPNQRLREDGENFGEVKQGQDRIFESAWQLLAKGGKDKNREAGGQNSSQIRPWRNTGER